MTPGSSQTFSCPWGHCGKTFNRKSDLSRHYRIHINERPYRCMVEGCNKTFIQRCALTVHSRTHTGEKPHVCGQEGCRKAFADSSSLTRHRRIHTGVRPYVCEESTCKRSFCRRTTLIRHQHRFHLQGRVTSALSENYTMGPFHEEPGNTSASYGQHFLLQQPYYEQAVTQSLGFNLQQNLELSYVAAQGTLLPTEIWNVPAMAPFGMQHTNQVYMQPMQHQYGQGYPSHTRPAFN